MVAVGGGHPVECSPNSDGPAHGGLRGLPQQGAEAGPDHRPGVRGRLLRPLGAALTIHDGDDRRVKAARLYAAGRSTHEIAAQLDVDATTIRRWLQPLVELRRRGPRGRLDVTDAEILQLRDSLHLSFAAIANEVAMSKTGVRMRYAVATTGTRPDR